MFLIKKTFGGNLALKIDISKAFDTLNWNFLLKVLQSFGFNSTFCNWISSILHSAKMSVSINGTQKGYFSCNRGVRQGDPLSPILFCLAEKVLSRSIKLLVDQGKLDLIGAARGSCIPSHCFYADDLMVFCKRKISNLEALKQVFTRYAECSGQSINLRKSFIFGGCITAARMNHMVGLLGFSIGSLPFTYLGAPIFKGKPKSIYFQPIVDRVRLKLANWKASLLSIAGRVQLIKSVVQGMLVHTMSIYSWPTKLLREMEKWIKNFIWSGDVSKKKMVAVAWKKVCADYDEGGLGTKSLISLNEATNLKMCWTLLHSDQQWAHILRNRALRDQRSIRYHIFSSIWSGVKDELQVIKNNSTWIVGNGKDINFWYDSWCDGSLNQLLNIPGHLILQFPAKLENFVENHRWNIPDDLHDLYPNLRSLVSKVTLANHNSSDSLVWKHTTTGELTLKDAYAFKKHASPKITWAKHIWFKDIPPSKSLLVWRMMLNKLPTDDNLASRGCQLPSMCSLCMNQVETSFHLFFDCSYALILWNWLSSTLNKPLYFNHIEEIWSLCSKRMSPQSKVVTTAVLINLLNAIWYARNQLTFNDKKINWRTSIANIISNTSQAGNNTNATSSSCLQEFTFIKKFNINLHPPRAPRIYEVIWQPPLHSWVKCNTDGASNSQAASSGGLFRDSEANFLLGFSENVGQENAYFAELSAAMRAIEIASQQNWTQLWLESDSMLVVNAFKNHALVPWKLRNRWYNCIHTVLSMNFIVSHIFREGNQCADILANVGLNSDVPIGSLEKPSCINSSFGQNKLGLPNYRFVNY